MSKDNKKSIKSQAEDIRKELDDLIGNNDPIQESIETDPELPAKRDLPALPTYGELKVNSSKKAQKTITSLMKFYLDEDIIEQIEKTVVFHKQYHSLEKYGIYYSDFRIPNKVFYCPIEEEFRCIQNIKRIYNKK